MKTISNLIIRHVNGNVPVEYSQFDANEREVAVRQAFLKEIGMDGAYSPRAFRKAYSKNEALIYEIVEEIIDDTVKGIDTNPFFNMFVERHDLLAGDTNEFVIKGKNALIVSETAGNFSVKRQRVESGQSFTVLPKTFTISVFEYVDRLAAGKSTFADFIQEVRDAVILKLEELAHTTLAKSLSNLPSAFVANGSYDEAAIMDVIERIQAVNQKMPILVGTRSGLARLQNKTVVGLSDAQRDQKARQGYVADWNGALCVAIDNFVKTGTHDLVLATNEIYVMSADDKPIKLTTEGGEVVKALSGTDTQDNTVSLTLQFKAGCACVHADVLGKIVIA